MSPVETLLAEVLAAHDAIRTGYGGVCCECGADTRTHKAQRDHEAAEQAKALREAGMLGGVVHTPQSMLRQIAETRSAARCSEPDCDHDWCDDNPPPPASDLIGGAR